MSGSTPGLNPPPRSLEQALADLTATFNKLALNDPRRARIAVQIRGIEAEIEARSPAP